MSSPLVHYDAVTGHSYTLAARVQLPTYALREYNNLQKRRLLERFVSPSAVILDLAGGKGGDLNKFAALEAAVVHLVDQSAESIAVARERYEKMKPAAPYIFSTQCASFTDEAAYPPVHGLVDVVSCQFAFHYVHPDSYDWVLQRIARALKPAGAGGGVFICTVPNPRKVEQFRNSKICRIKPVDSVRYSFYLQGSVGTDGVRPGAASGVLEYKVEYDALCAAAQRAGLELVHYRDYEPSDSLRWDENAVAMLYCEYSFRRLPLATLAPEPSLATPLAPAALGSFGLRSGATGGTVITETGWCPLRGQVVDRVISDGFSPSAVAPAE
jgi:SAM-dependent methyltransferase